MPEPFPPPMSLTITPTRKALRIDADVSLLH